MMTPADIDALVYRELTRSKRAERCRRRAFVGFWGAMVALLLGVKW